MADRLGATIIVTAMAMLIGGCQTQDNIPPRDYQTVANDPSRDTQLAQSHNAKGAKLLNEGKLDQAEKELRAALAADLFFGPSHNNLGTVYYRQAKYYLAAWEFQYATKLMPNHISPRNNLGLVFEAVGKLGDAAKTYEDALQIEPKNADVIANLARVYIRDSRKDKRTRELLDQIVASDDRPQWVTWAREQLALFVKTPQATTASSAAQ